MRPDNTLFRYRAAQPQSLIKLFATTLLFALPWWTGACADGTSGALELGTSEEALRRECDDCDDAPEEDVPERPRLPVNEPSTAPQPPGGVAIATAPIVTAPFVTDVPLDDHQHMPLINMGSGKCFEPSPLGGHSNGLPIQQRACSPGIVEPNHDGIAHPIQYYQFQDQGYVAFNDQGWFPCPGCISRGTTGYLIRNRDTDLCLDARDGAKTDQSVVQQWQCRDRTARSMLWYVEPGDFPGMFKIRNFNSDLCLDVRAASWDEGAQLQQYHCTSNNVAQNFTQKFPVAFAGTNLSGRWTEGSSRNAVISTQFPAISIDMSAFNRPAARGWFSSYFTITVNFPDYGTVTGDITGDISSTRINWSNGSAWVSRP